jgi:hypothetical protein
MYIDSLYLMLAHKVKKVNIYQVQGELLSQTLHTSFTLLHYYSSISFKKRILNEYTYENPA